MASLCSQIWSDVFYIDAVLTNRFGFGSGFGVFRIGDRCAHTRMV